MNGKQGGEALSFSRTSRSYNSLPRHLPSSYSVPYGYKIDLDFVRFCDSYYDNRDSQRPASRLRRTKKSHKKSYNTLLGLHKEKADKPKSISPPAQAPAHFFPPSRTQTDNKLATDLESSLGQVMSDFEETFQRSRVRQENHAYLSDGGEYRPNGRRYHSLPRPATLRSWRTVEQDLPRASSNSSLSDSSDGAGNGLGRSSDLAREMAETISSLQKLSRMEDGPELRPGHRRSEVTTHVTSEGTPGSGREQTDSRLVGRKECRMETRVTVSSNSQRQAEDTRQEQANNEYERRIRELEEQVKAIPLLKHKLSVLREEKRSMEEQLTRSRPRREPQGDPPERTTQHTVSLRSRSLSPAQDPSSPDRRVLQDATTSCRVLTRDIGVDGCPERLDATPMRESPSSRGRTRDVGLATREVTPPARPVTRDFGVGYGLAVRDPTPPRVVTSPKPATRDVGVGYGLAVREPTPPRVVTPPKPPTRDVGVGYGLAVRDPTPPRVVAPPKPPTRDFGVGHGLAVRDPTPPRVVAAPKPITRDMGVGLGMAVRDPTPPPAPVRVPTRDACVGGGPPTPPPRPAPAQRSVYVLTDLNAGQENRGRRKFSLGSILSGHGGNRTVGVNTRRSELTVGGTHVETVAGDDSVQEILERERRRPPGVERGSQTRAAAAVSAETSTDRPPATRDVGASTELGFDELRQMCDLRDQLDELRELQRSTRASSSETRDTFTQIKEYELGVNYVRGAFSFVKSVNCSSQTEPPPQPTPLRSSGAQTDREPEPWRPSTRAFAAQVHPAMTSVGVQCLEEDSRGVEARPERRDVAVTAEFRRFTRSVATATDAAPAVTRPSPAHRRDAATATVAPLVMSRAVLTDRLKEPLKKVKTTMTEVTPLRSVASGEHLVNRHQSCQTAPSPAPAAAAAAPAPAPAAPAPPVSSRHQATQTLAAPPSTPPATPADRESPLPPLSRSSSGSKIPRRMATPPTARKAAPAAPTPPAMVRRAASFAGVTTPPTGRKTPTAAGSATPPTARKAAGAGTPPTARRIPVPVGSTTPPTPRRELRSPSPSVSTARPAAKESSPTNGAPAVTAESGPAAVPESARLVSGAGQVSDAEPKQRQFGRRDTFVAPRDTDSQRQELGQGDAADQKSTLEPVDLDDFTAVEEMISTEEMKEKKPEAPRIKVEPSPEMRAALKVLNDSLSAPGAGKGSSAVAQARALVQAEWFKVAGSRDADPLVVEDYLDVLEGMSLDLLKTVVNMADNNSNTVMHYAVSHGNFDVVSVLLDSKVVDVQRQNNAGYTCIMLLSLAHITSETHRQVVRRLFQNGDVNVRAKQHGQTALMLAVSHGRLDMVNLLLEAGADINIQDEDGSTSLMCASEHGHAAIVRVLLAHPECDTQLTDNDGCTALQVAMEAGHRDVGLLLYAHSNFSRGSSPYGSLRLKKGGSRTPGGRASATPPRGATPTGTPGLGKRSLSSLH
ncbi:KN motif and ankyrin repeat domain-containing protein 3-like [Amphibalanus amphitrite]|uniref:KN motif and ankyrin repeat domain-containing protein 3-like n=1 Tax=Amphibalanus amphitrite TaxID=1232801 RepID=UPI001C902D46|nr:KN motif and ankyrin repeat domain-containing protein 3-like [Amphibalanus amphitrite]XP_043227481.1 KN motif and ankyrin repeat domain-containing protein 3-like [Amphibalanus amphitrite]